MHKLKIFSLLIGLFFSLKAVDVHEVEDMSRFHQLIRNYPFAIVMFFKQLPDFDSFTILSRMAFYKEAGMPFIRIPIQASSLKEYGNDFGIKKTPFYVLFKDGEIIKNNQGDVVVLEGYASTSQLRSFIDKYLGQRVQDDVPKREYIESSVIDCPSYVYDRVMPCFPAGFGSSYYSYYGDPHWYSPAVWYGYWDYDLCADDSVSDCYE